MSKIVVSLRELASESVELLPDRDTMQAINLAGNLGIAVNAADVSGDNNTVTQTNTIDQSFAAGDITQDASFTPTT